MIRKLSIFSLILVLLLAACTMDDAPVPAVATHPVSVELITGLAETRAASGDPGLDDALPPTRYIYAWAWYKTGAETYNAEFVKAVLDRDDWEDDALENESSRYTTEELGFSFANLMEGVDVGKVYALASERELTNDQLVALYCPFGITVDNYNDGMWTKTGLTTSPKTALEGMLLATDGWTGLELRDLYSNPEGDTKKDGKNLGNGVIKKAGTTITVGTVRLYHCAAKVDFKWEVAEALRPTTSIAGITCTGLPTTLKVFKPTQNPAKKADNTTGNTDGTCLVVGTDATAVNALTPANKHIGRAYAYVLQPAAGTINYSVAFAGTASRAPKDATTPTAPTGSIYTTWYRVVAEVRQ